MLVVEARTSGLQARFFSSVDTGLRVEMEPGPSGAMVYADTGPYDVRLGYARLPSFIGRLEKSGFRVDGQARSSPRLRELVGPRPVPDLSREDAGGPPRDRPRGHAHLLGRYPERIYERFDAIPPAVVATLLFIEDRQLLDADRPHLNPALNWGRLARAMVVDLRVRLGEDARMIGASTLATQIEKFRHSPDGRTSSAREKLRQMLSATFRAYQGGRRRSPHAARSSSTT